MSTNLFLKTKYGKILKEQLKEIKIKNAPATNLPNYLPDLYIEEIDEKASYLKCFSEGQFFVIDSDFLLKNTKKIYSNFKFVKAKGAKPINLPKKLNPKLAYFVGYFLGDGGLKDIKKTYLKTRRFEHKIIVGDEFLEQIKKIKKLFYELFGAVFPIRTERIQKGEQLYYLNPTNKVIYRFLTEVFGVPSGKKYETLKVPILIENSFPEIKKWFIRGVFDADGDTRAVERGLNSQPRIKLRMKSHNFIKSMKEILQEVFNISVNGPYFDLGKQSSYIQIERHKDIEKLNNEILFIHPVKQWRLNKMVSLMTTNKFKTLAHPIY
ncbi:MAG: hypothetical protein COT90_01110 [Candidatus Diapherotrites archaeon CG10_big_fil_rev_8_21_14_0_10_31_34]|nr:MAG: hypothetical protein COT90_01110 [Candidatus Diapherotrites archaeon CG10_big_fil_rev_8_21_14_0_10_31_34]